jgi:hypothetical protein
MIAFILSILILAGLAGVAYGIHAVSQELKGLDEPSKRDADMTKEIERWRSGK